MPRHKHADLIHAWADGAEIQVKYQSDSYWSDEPDPIWVCDDDTIEYRIKPKSIKYRRYLYKRGFENDSSMGVFCMNSWDKFEPEQSSSFIRWIDQDWQEIEEI